MGVVVGLLFGVGLFLLVTAPLAADGSAVAVRPLARQRALLAEAGLPSWNVGRFCLVSAAAGLAAALIVLLLSATWPLVVAFGLFGAVAPHTYLTRRRRQRQDERRELWPHVVDDLASAVRAGLALPEALSALAVRGPEPLRPAFAGFAEDYRASGSFRASLDRLGVTLADPIADRILEALRLAREVGGSDLGQLLRSLSHFLRDEARVRSEIAARQSWTVNGARLALAAPWLVLLLLSTRGTAGSVYRTGPGILVLAIGGAASLVAYALMRRIGRLPTARRLRLIPDVGSGA